MQARSCEPWRLTSDLLECELQPMDRPRRMRRRRAMQTTTALLCPRRSGLAEGLAPR